MSFVQLAIKLPNEDVEQFYVWVHVPSEFKDIFEEDHWNPIVHLLENCLPQRIKDPKSQIRVIKTQLAKPNEYCIYISPYIGAGRK